jgi:hypothetical protein
MELTLRRTMRGEDKKQSSMLMLMDGREALRELSPVFDRMYAQGGRPSIPPERLLKSIRRPTPTPSSPARARGRRRSFRTQRTRSLRTATA